MTATSAAATPPKERVDVERDEAPDVPEDAVEVPVDVAVLVPPLPSVANPTAAGDEKRYAL